MLEQKDKMERMNYNGTKMIKDEKDWRIQTQFPVSKSSLLSFVMQTRSLVFKFPQFLYLTIYGISCVWISHDIIVTSFFKQLVWIESLNVCEKLDYFIDKM